MVNLFSHADRAVAIRATQAFVYRFFEAGRVKVPIHFAFGHEQVAEAITSIGDRSNLLFLPHRNIHIQLAYCLSLSAEECANLLEEYLGAITLSAETERTGSVGAMNFVFSGQDGYSSSVLGNQLGVAVGASLACQSLRSVEKRTLVVLGDGGIEEGRFWESLIFIKAHELPIDVVIENNGWSMQSSIEQRRRSINLRGLADSIGLNYIAVRNERLSEGNPGSPRIIEFTIDTLGSTTGVDSQTSRQRVINYHSGALLDGIERRHYSDFFGMSPLDKLSPEAITPSFQSQFENFISPLAKKYGIDGFV